MPLTRKWDKTFPQSSASGAPEGDVQEPLRHHLGGRPVPAKERSGQKLRGARRLRPFRRGEGAVVRPVRAAMAERGFVTLAFDPSLHRRKRR